MDAPTSDVAFSPAVKAIQARKGSREAYARMEARGGWAATITPDLKDELERLDSFFLATASRDGQPYIQHRGGPAGFVRVLDERRFAFVDFSGNQQFISQGNLSENPQAHVFAMDYANQRRVKIWGRARVVEGDAALIAQLMPAGYRARAEQVIVFEVTAWDRNCPQHIPQKLDAERVLAALEEREREIAALQAEVARLRAAAG